MHDALYFFAAPIGQYCLSDGWYTVSFDIVTQSRRLKLRPWNAQYYLHTCNIFWHRFFFRHSLTPKWFFFHDLRAGCISKISLRLLLPLWIFIFRIAPARSIKHKFQKFKRKKDITYASGYNITKCPYMPIIERNKKMRLSIAQHIPVFIFFCGSKKKLEITMFAISHAEWICSLENGFFI